MPYYDITEETLNALGLNLTGNSGSAALPTSIRWDVEVGGIPFLLGISDKYPMRRETSEFRRQRIDNERNPGEQSLDSGYWIRSQSSWHYGSGLTSAEPLEVAEEEARFRYAVSGGINPWTAGTMSLLNDTASVLSSTGTSQLLLGIDTGVLHADGNVLKYVPNSGSPVSVTWGGSGIIESITSDGTNYYVGTSDGIYKGALPSGTGTRIWNTGSRTLVRWLKSRLMATVGRGVYELVGSGPALPTPIDSGSTRPSGWVWTDLAEGPTAIYLSGYAGDQSTIEKITIDTTATTVTLDVPTVSADMPRSELVYSLYSYVGSYMVIGTSKGVRVASINNNYTAAGTLTVGPLLLSVADGVRDTVAQDSYVYVPVGTQGQAGNRATRAGLYRINLGRSINQSELQFASAPDLVAPVGTAGAAEQVTISGGKIWFAVQGAGVFKQQETFVSEGWLETGRIRLGTVEPKSWIDTRLIGSPSMAGSVTAFASRENSSTPSAWVQTLTITGTNHDDSGTLGTVANVPNSELYYAVRLQPNTDRTQSPVLNGYQIRAVPSPSRTEMVAVPVMCWDFELDRQGVRYGRKGGAFQRFQLLKGLEAATALIQFRDFTTGESQQAYIERVTYDRTTPPTRNVSGNGGIITILLRVI